MALRSNYKRSIAEWFLRSSTIDEQLQSEVEQELKEGNIKMLAKTVNFFREVKVELKKVSWPDKNELLGSTAVVVISVAILAIFIGICDFIFSNVIHAVIR